MSWFGFGGAAQPPFKKEALEHALTTIAIRFPLHLNKKRNECIVERQDVIAKVGRWRRRAERRDAGRGQRAGRRAPGRETNSGACSCAHARVRVRVRVPVHVRATSARTPRVPQPGKASALAAPRGMAFSFAASS